jgi:hypothetical protein
MNDLIHHYTSIDTLALILKSRKIRFNRLDLVDDISEGERFKPYNLSKFIFVSCWTINQQEDIPQWYMYTDKMKGVRISLSRENFFDFKYDHPLLIPNQFGTIYEMKSAIPMETALNDKYFILGSDLTPENPGSLVEYDVNPMSKYENPIIEELKDGMTQLEINAEVFKKTVKSEYWKFQEEFRFTLFALPNREPENPDSKRLVTLLIDSIKKGIGPRVNYLDLEISPEAFDKMTITIGPMCNEGDLEIVNQLVNNYAPTALIKKSELTGKIKV